MSKYLKNTDYPIIKLALSLRYYQHTVAAHFGVNQGRISEFKRSAFYRICPMAAVLPVGFPPRP